MSVKFLPPANEVCEGNVFTGVCLSTGWGLCSGGLCLGGGVLCQGDPPYGNMQAVRILLECIFVTEVWKFHLIDARTT